MGRSVVLTMSHTSSRHSSRALTVTIALIVALAITGGIWWATSASRAAGGSDIPLGALPAETGMGVVELVVHDRQVMQAYYEDAVGLEVIDESDDAVTLGRGVPLIRLVTSDGDEFASFEEAGLYHSAILYPDEPALARVLASIVAVAPESYQGASDHAVSLAFYFVDPEGNGLELYVDRPRDEWVWEGGLVSMGSAPLDPNAFIQEHLAGATASTAVMGHVHLKVGDLEEAEAFYADTLGFAVTARSDGALFYAAGGYHHHVATNTWMSGGAGARTNATGLGALTIEVPDAADLTAIAERLDAAGHNAEASDDALSVEDPWGNVVHIRVASA